MIPLQDLIASFGWKKNDEYCARRLGVTPQDYSQEKARVLPAYTLLCEQASERLVKDLQQQLSGETSETESLSALREVRACPENGTSEIRAVSERYLRDADEIIELLGIDTTRWRLASYWNKQQPSGLWLISAQVQALSGDYLGKGEAEEILQRVFSQPQASPPPPVVTTPGTPRALMVYLADRHIAAHVSGRALFENPYDAFHYAQRLDQVLQEIAQLQSRLGEFSDIYLIDLGDKMDGLDGMTTRKGHKLPQNLSNRQAFDTAVEAEKNFLDGVIALAAASQVHVYQHCNSNHGGDFDYLVARALEMYLHTRYGEGVKTRIIEKFIEHLHWQEHTLLLTHGKDEEDLKHGLPLNLNPKTENYLRKYLTYYDIDPKQRQVSLVKADLHQAASQHVYGLRYRNVLSLFGSSKWSGTNFGPGQAGCSYEILEAGTGRILEGQLLFH